MVKAKEKIIFHESILTNNTKLETDMVDQIIYSALLIANLKEDKIEEEYKVSDKGRTLYRKKSILLRH